MEKWICRRKAISKADYPVRSIFQLMNDKDKKTVNTEEQNRAVNPGDSEYQEDSISQQPADEPSKTADKDNESREKPNETKRDQRVEGDEINIAERKKPNL